MNISRYYFASEAVAKKKLSDLRYIVDMYGNATVGDYYDICSFSSARSYDYGATKYGWFGKHIDRARVVSDYPNRWYIDLPDPVLIDSEYYKEKSTTHESPEEEPIKPESLNIIIHTNEVGDPDAVIANVFQYVYTIKDRMVNLTIM